MKIIYPNTIYDASIENENANFPASRLYGESGKKPQRLAKSTLQTDTITLYSSGAADTFAIFNTNATSVSSIAIRTGVGLIWTTGDTGLSWGLDETHGLIWETSSSMTPEFDVTQLGFGVLWGEYTNPTGPHAIDITLTTTEAALHMGCGVAGVRSEFADPDFGVNQSFKDYSVRQRYNSASLYTSKRDVTRTFQFRLVEDRDTDYYKFMETIWWNLGPDPVAWRLVSDGLTNKEWIVFAGYNSSMPQGNHAYPDDSIITVNLEEVL